MRREHMVDAGVHAIDRGALERDGNDATEGRVDPGRDESDPDFEYGEFPVRNTAVDHPKGAILRITGSRDAEQFAKIRNGWCR